jgi:coenzyme F420 hydrogenase subunit beta
MKPELHKAVDVVRWRLCLGCGACAVACERGNIFLEDIPGVGIRPRMRGGDCDMCGKCLESCPGVGIVHGSRNGFEACLEELRDGWGPILEIYEGYAADPEIRRFGSSGGAAAALSLFCVESGLAGGVLHVGNDDEHPWRNKTVVSRTRREILSRTGSRYSPASPCEGLGEIRHASSPHVFIGKPCDIQGLRKTEALASELREKVGLAIGIFCAGTPATMGVLDLLAGLQISREDLQDVRFRGDGWPGSFSVRLKDGSRCPSELSYAESWGFLQKYRPFRCYLCPDGTSEFADISCGDPWYMEPAGDDPGQSLVLVRTQRGREVLQRSMEAGYLNLKRVDPKVIELSQKNLLMKRRAIWGRLITMKAFGLPVPGYEGFPLFKGWLALPLGEKTRSIVGTARRILKRKYYKPFLSDSAG